MRVSIQIAKRVWGIAMQVWIFTKKKIRVYKYEFVDEIKEEERIILEKEEKKKSAEAGALSLPSENSGALSLPSENHGALSLAKKEVA